MSRLMEIKRNAVTLIARNGFGAMSLRDLARASGLQAGSLYAHYKSKDSLLLEVMIDHLEELISHWQESDQRRKGPKVRLSAFVSAYIEFHSAHIDQCLILESDIRSLDEEGRAAVNELKRQYEGELAGVLLQGQRSGEFRIDDIPFAVVTLTSVLQGICSRYCRDNDVAVRHAISRATVMAFSMVGADRTTGCVNHV